MKKTVIKKSAISLIIMGSIISSPLTFADSSQKKTNDSGGEITRSEELSSDLVEYENNLVETIDENDELNNLLDEIQEIEVREFEEIVEANPELERRLDDLIISWEDQDILDDPGLRMDNEKGKPFRVSMPTQDGVSGVFEVQVERDSNGNAIIVHFNSRKDAYGKVEFRPGSNTLDKGGNATGESGSTNLGNYGKLVFQKIVEAEPKEEDEEPAEEECQEGEGCSSTECDPNTQSCPGEGDCNPDIQSCYQGQETEEEEEEQIPVSDCIDMDECEENTVPLYIAAGLNWNDFDEPIAGDGSEGCDQRNDNNCDEGYEVRQGDEITFGNDGSGCADDRDGDDCQQEEVSEMTQEDAERPDIGPMPGVEEDLDF